MLLSYAGRIIFDSLTKTKDELETKPEPDYGTELYTQIVHQTQTKTETQSLTQTET